MSRRCSRFDPSAPQKQGQAEAHEAQRRLSVLGQPQLLVIGTDEEPAQIQARNICNPIAELRDLRISQELGSHAGMLRTLAWKNERDLRHRHRATLWTRPYSVLMTSRPA
jgi:hypothetical protein